MTRLSKLETLKAWAEDLSKCESIKGYFFWIVGSFADKNLDSKDFDVVVSGMENYEKIKAIFDDAQKLAKEYELPLDIVYWSTPPIGIPKNFEVRKYRNGHRNNGALWAKVDLENSTFEDIEYGISRITTRKGFEFRSDINVMKASAFLQEILF